MRISYARVSTLDQNLDLQEDALKAAGCEKIYTDKTGGTKAERTGLERALADLRAGDRLVVWKLDRLGRSMRHLKLDGLWRVPGPILLRPLLRQGQDLGHRRLSGPPPRRRSGPVAWHDVLDGDFATLDAVEYDGQDMSRREDFHRRITRRPGLRKHLNLAVDHVDEPVDGDAGPT